MPHVLTLVEQFWHKVPGGTAQATERTLAALLDRNEFTVTGLVAAHLRRNRRTGRSRVPDACRVVGLHLPRPVLYESWLRFGWPRVDRHHDADSLFWASSMIVAPSRRPAVTTVHDLDFLDHPQFLTPRGRRFFPLAWDVARSRSQHFVCPSSAVADQCRAHGVADERISVVPWGVDRPLVCVEDAPGLVIDVVAEVTRSTPSASAVPDDFVLLVAPDDPRKNPEGCAAALAAVDCPAIIIGSSPGDGMDTFAALGSRIIRLGRVDPRTLSALYHRASALLFPSHREGFGLPVLEAMAHGLPVVTSRATATEEVADGAAVLIDPADHAEIAVALDRVLGDRALRRTMIEQGRDRAAAFTWDHTAAGYSQIFETVL